MIHLKSDREIGKMRQSGLVVWKAHQIAKRMVAPGVSTGEINAEIEAYFDKVGAEPLFKNYPHHSRGKPSFPAVTCMSVNEEVVHGIPNKRQLREGDILSLDTGVRIGGWCGDAAVTYPVGEIDPEVARLLEVTEATFNLAFELLHTKSKWSQIAREMAQLVSDNGFSTVECFVGHGIGKKMHEDPQVPNFVSRALRSSGDFRIEPGLVIAVEPMVNMGTKRVKMLRDDWTQVTADGKPSSHYEHTIAITDDGPTLLTVAPQPSEEKLLLT
ncbi:MAG: type I methionyl aminopeptidase [Aeoliella sp.]